MRRLWQWFLYGKLQVVFIVELAEIGRCEKSAKAIEVASMELTSVLGIDPSLGIAWWGVYGSYRLAEAHIAHPHVLWFPRGRGGLPWQGQSSSCS